MLISLPCMSTLAHTKAYTLQYMGLGGVVRQPAVQGHLHGSFPTDPAVLGHSQAVVCGHRGAAASSGPLEQHWSMALQACKSDPSVGCMGKGGNLMHAPLEHPPAAGQQV